MIISLDCKQYNAKIYTTALLHNAANIGSNNDDISQIKIIAMLVIIMIILMIGQ